MFANAVIAVGIFIIGIFGCFSAQTAGDTREVVYFFAAGAWFFLLSAGFAWRNRLIVAVTSIPILFFASVLVLILLFAPLSWGNKGTSTAYVLQGISLLIVLVQVLGLFSVFAHNQRPEHDGK